MNMVLFSADAVRLSLRVSPRHTSLGTLGHVRVMSLRKGPRFLMGTGGLRVFVRG